MNFNDFYDYINSEWIKKTNIPEGKNLYSTFTCIDINNDERINKLFQEETNPLYLLYRELFNVNDNRDESLFLKAIDSIDSYEKLSKVMGFLTLFDKNTIILLKVDADTNNTQKNALYLYPETGYMNDYILKNFDTEYRNFLYESLNILNLKSKYHEIYDFQVKLINNILITNNYEKIDDYKHCTWKDLNSKIKTLNIEKFYKPFENLIGFKPEKIIITDNHYLENLDTVLLTTRLDVIKDYLRFNVLCNYKLHTTTELNKLIHKFCVVTGKRLGSEEEYKKQQIKKYFLEKFETLFNYKYLKSYYDENTEKKVLQLINLIKISTKDVIEKITWMSDETKNNMLLKLKHMKFKMGGNKKKHNYDKLFKLSEGKPKYQVVLIHTLYEKEKMFSQLLKPVDKCEWSMSSFIVNAYYSVINNEIVFPAAIFEKPFFSPDNCLAMNLGGIGTVIAHEIAHAFFEIGMKFDHNGNKKEWWKKEDILEYEKRSYNLIKQFNDVVILNKNVDGKMTLGENLSDFMAIKVVTNFLNNVNASKEAYQQMYSNYARIWRVKLTDKKYLHKSSSDPHAIGRLRTNIILRNTPEFYYAFDIKKDHPMFLPKEERMHLLN